MIYNYIVKRFKNGEPFFLSELPAKSKSYLKLEMKRLVDKGLVSRYLKGVYYLPYKTILGTEGKVSFNEYIKKKFFFDGNKTIGYLTGVALANMYGFTTQVSAVYSIVSNAATTKERKLNIKDRRVIIYKPYVEITNDNVNELEFLELMRIVDVYAEYKTDEIKNAINKYITNKMIDFKKVKEYIACFPDIVYKNIYKYGVMNELVQR